MVAQTLCELGQRVTNPASWLPECNTCDLIWFDRQETMVDFFPWNWVIMHTSVLFELQWCNKHSNDANSGRWIELQLHLFRHRQGTPPRNCTWEGWASCPMQRCCSDSSGPATGGVRMQSGWTSSWRRHDQIGGCPSVLGRIHPRQPCRRLHSAAWTPSVPRGVLHQAADYCGLPRSM